MKMLSVRQYAAKKRVKRQAILAQIDNKTLPYGVIAVKVDTYYVIILSN